MNSEQEEMKRVLSNLSESEVLIFKEILQTEKEFLHRKSLSGTSVISDIMGIIRERIVE